MTWVGYAIFVLLLAIPICLAAIWLFQRAREARRRHVRPPRTYGDEGGHPQPVKLFVIPKVLKRKLGQYGTVGFCSGKQECARRSRAKAPETGSDLPAGAETHDGQALRRDIYKPWKVGDMTDRKR